MTTIGATKVVPLRMVQGDRERINRTRRVLEQDIARLERSLAQRRSKEGQEATRATILSKRAQLHRLNDYLKVAVPYQVQRRVKPIPKSHVPRDVAPKGSALHQKQMREARRMMRKLDKARKQLAQQAAQPLNLKKAPKVVDEKSLQKYTEVMESNKKAIHEMQMKMASMERQRKLEKETKTTGAGSRETTGPYTNGKEGNGGLAQAVGLLAKPSVNCSKECQHGEQQKERRDLCPAYDVQKEQQS